MRTVSVFCGLFLLLSPAVWAQFDEPSSAWSEGSHSSVRLIAGGRTADGAFRVGVEVRMKQGFKTYWRMPGDAGVPPVFDWTISDNLGSVSVRWPAPHRFVDDGITTIGYKEHVIFPVILRSADAGKPVTAKLRLDYAVCDRICIPATAEVSLKLPDAIETTQSAALEQFRARTPRSKEPGKLDDRLGLVSASYVPDKTRRAVDIVVAIPVGASFKDAFLEGPDGWLFGAPVMTERNGDRVTLRIPLDDRPKNVVGLVPVVLTLTGTPHATEIRFDIDLEAPKP